MIAKDLLNNAYHKALGEVFKAKEGDKKMIFGKPFEMKGGKWVPSSGGGKKEEAPKKEGKPKSQETPAPRRAADVVNDMDKLKKYISDPSTKSEDKEKAKLHLQLLKMEYDEMTRG